MSQPSPSSHVAILGAGITGLTAAWHLRQAGVQVTVFERSSRVGGAIGAHHAGAWLHELGPNSLLEGSAAVSALVRELELDSRRIYASPAARQRYVVRGGRLVAMPTSPLRFATTRLFSLRAKLKLLGEPWRIPAAPYLDESVADFVVRRLGREFLDYAINPFVGGVYAGDPALLSVRHGFPKLHALEQEHGSLIRGALARRNASGGPKGRIFSFPTGLAELPAALARKLGDAVRLHTEITAVQRLGSGWQVVSAENGATRIDDFDAVVCALPADALAAIDFAGVPAAHQLETLTGIPQPPVASVFTGFRCEDVAHPLDGFGVLVPQVEHGLILGTLFSSTLFPGRAPDGHVALTSFVGGMRAPELAGLDDAEIVRIVREELARLLGVRGSPAFVHVRRWPHAIPQYVVGYQRYHDLIAAVETAAPGLFIGGTCRDGISIANCIESSRRLADAALGYASSAIGVVPLRAKGKVQA